MICLCCAQIHSHVALWQKMYGHNDRSKNGIELYRIEKSLRSFKNRNERNFRLHLCLKHYRRRYAGENPKGEGNAFRTEEAFDRAAENWKRWVNMGPSMKEKEGACKKEKEGEARGTKKRKKEEEEEKKTAENLSLIHI